MKKCPFCKSDIEDNARFCLYCMSSLEDKKIVENKKYDNKWWLCIIAIVLLFALILGISIFALSKNPANNSSDESLVQSELISHTDSLYSNSISSIGSSSKNSSENEFESSSETSSKKPPETTNANNTSSNNKTDDKTHHTSSEIVNSTEQTSGVTTPSPSEPTETEKPEITDSGYQSDDDTPTQTAVTYTYRDATTVDCFPTGYTPIYTPENVIVITGVNSIASNGVYIVPEKIDGKKVAAIMSSAFCDESISKTVKKVVLPPTVRTIWHNAFSKCYNLTDIYIQSEVIGIYESAFPNASDRTDTLSIHCKYNCRNFEFYYYRNIADDYNAQYQEWNGGDIE